MGVSQTLAETKDEKGSSPKDKLLAALKKDEERGMAVTNKWRGLWSENLEYFFGTQLKGRKRHKDWEWVVVNYIWPSCFQEIAKISRYNPQFTADPWEASDSDAAEVWQGILQWLWDRGLSRKGMRIEQLHAILCGKLHGYRVFKLYWEDRVRWDAQARKWVGDVRGRLWNPSLFWATGDQDINDGNCGTVRYVELEYALARWPDYSDKLKEEADRFHDELMSGDETIRGGKSAITAYPDPHYGGIDAGPEGTELNRILELVQNRDDRRDPADDTKWVRISDQYFQDYEENREKRVELISKDELLNAGVLREEAGRFFNAETNELLGVDEWPTRDIDMGKVPKYPNGRNVLRAGDVILNEDEEDQVWPYQQWPFVVAPHYLLPLMWQGSDAIQTTKTAQDMINVSVSHLVNYMKMYGDPKLAIETGAAEQTNPRSKKHFKIGSGAGSIIRLARGGLKRFKILDPPQMSPVIHSLYMLWSQEFKNLLGLQDIAMGKKSPGDLTATESSMLAMSANDRIHLQTVVEQQWIKQVGELAAEICQHHYTPDRFVRVVGEQGVPGIVEITQKLKEVRFDIQVQVGSTMPFDEEKRIARYKEAFGMVQQPVANPMLPEMLRALEIPNWRKILERYDAWRVYAMFMEATQAVKAGKIPPEMALQKLTMQLAKFLIPQGAKNAGQVQGPVPPDEGGRGGVNPAARQSNPQGGPGARRPPVAQGPAGPQGQGP